MAGVTSKGLISTGSIRAWVEIQKFPRHSNDVFSFILGSVLAWYYAGQFHWGVFILGLLAVFFIANGIYLSNEYQDYESDRLNRDRIGGENGMGLVTTGGTRVLVNGKLKKEHVLRASAVFFALAVPLGLVIQFVFKTGPWTIPLGFLGMMLAYGYSNPPFKASYRGLGETFMMLGYAALVFTAYYIQAGPSWFPIVIALPRILTVPALKLLRNFPDSKADKASGKRTLVVIFGKEKMRILYILLVISAILLFIPAYMATGSVFIIINIVPVAYFILSLIPMMTGAWRERTGLEKACTYGFKGLLLTPITLIATFVFAGLL